MIAEMSNVMFNEGRIILSVTKTITPLRDEQFIGSNMLLSFVVPVLNGSFLAE